MRSYFANCHPAIEAQLRPQATIRRETSKRTAEAAIIRQLGAAEAFAKSVKYSCENNRHKCLTAAVTQYSVPKMYKMLKTSIKSKFMNVDYSATTGMWSSVSISETYFLWKLDQKQWVQMHHCVLT